MTVLTIQKEKSSIPDPADPCDPSDPADPEAATAPTPRIDPSLMPRLTTTVPREYVHRSSHAEVFLTGCEKQSDSRFTLAGQWPRAHTFFTTPDGTSHDPLQAAETIRQVGLFLAHAEFGVPLGHQFLMWDLHLATHPEHMTIGTGPSELSLTAVVTDMGRRGRRLSEFTLEITVIRGGRVCAVGGGRFTCLSPATYRRLRGEAGAIPELSRVRRRRVAPACVGKLLPFDVVLSPTDRPGRWLLDADPRHPILFDHSGDHYPGMILLEAARQAACGLLHPGALSITSACVDFQRYAEFNSPCWIDAAMPPTQATGTPSVLVTGRQGEHVVFTALVSGTVALPETR